LVAAASPSPATQPQPPTANGIKWPVASPAATGASTPATASTAVCNSPRPPGPRMAAASTPRRPSWPPRISRSRSLSGCWRLRVVAPGRCAAVRFRARHSARSLNRHRHRPAWICPGSTVCPGSTMGRRRHRHRRRTPLCPTLRRRQTRLLQTRRHHLRRRRPPRRQSCWPHLANRHRPRMCRRHLRRTWHRRRRPPTLYHRRPPRTWRLPQTPCRPRPPQTRYRPRLPQTRHRPRLPQTPYRPRLPQTPYRPRLPQTPYRPRLPLMPRRRLLTSSTPLDHSRCRRSATRRNCGTRSRAKTSTGTTRWTRLHSRPAPTEGPGLGGTYA